MVQLQSGQLPAERVRGIIDQAAKDYHIIGAMSFGDVPEGHSVVLNVIRANSDPSAGDVYDVGQKKYGLTGNFLNALADAAGVSVAESRLLAYQANYCIAEVTVERQGLDGRVRRNTARKIMDLREGSGQLTAMRDAAKAKGKDAETQIREQRLRIAEHADSKARLRAIRALLSIRTYTQEELRKPFAVFALQFTGKSRDPELRKLFAVGLMQASLGATGALYGAAPPPAPMMLGGGPSPLPMLGSGPMAPFDAGDGVPDEDDLPPGGNGGGGGGGSAAPSPRVAAQPGDPTRIRIPGKSGKVVADAEDKDLTYWEKRGRSEFLDGKWEGDKYAESNLRQLLTIRAEMRRRQLPVDACPALDPTLTPKDAGPRPPSDRGAMDDPRAKDKALADDAFGPDDDPNEYE